MKQNCDAMFAHGLDADALITYYESNVVGADDVQCGVEKLENDLLHAAANAADSMRTAFKALEALVQDLQEKAPFDPATAGSRRVSRRMANANAQGMRTINAIAA